ncbi:hypothetical protein ACV34H_33515, partial [Pseudomonas aeruginosa]
MYSEDVLWLYRTFAPTIQGAFVNPGKLAAISYSVSTASVEGVKRCRDYNPKLLESGIPWCGIEINERTH